MNIVNMVDYYLVHKNADNSVIEYLKGKLDNSSIEELIIVQIELLYKSLSDKLVTDLVYFITLKVNEILKDMSLYDLANLICSLEVRKSDLENDIKEKNSINDDLFIKINKKDFSEEETADSDDNEIASKYINIIQNNNFNISEIKSKIKSIDIWIKNLDKNYNSKLDSKDLKDLLDSYVKMLPLMNRNDHINKYIISLSTKIDTSIINNNVIDMIININPVLFLMYKENSNEKKELYKLLDYYLSIVELTIKNNINQMLYEERIMLKEKLEVICKELATNDREDDDYKIPIIESYIKYL